MSYCKSGGLLIVKSSVKQYKFISGPKNKQALKEKDPVFRILKYIREMLKCYSTVTDFAKLRG